VGRDAELAQLHKWLEKALSGERQIVFVTGEPGIGKTTLVETFLHRAATDESMWIGRGQCIEHFGAGEAYLPVLEALGRLCRESEHDRLMEVLHQHAPTWLVQMPALLSAAELEALQRKMSGATRERMLREMAEALEVLTAERGLVLWLEDLHWSDYSTLDLLASLARRLEKARLLVLGTYRPVDVIVREHPLKTVKQELELHGHCEELALELLPEGAIAEYMAVRFSVGATGRSPHSHQANFSSVTASSS
jgi:predicted ATPase